MKCLDKSTPKFNPGRSADDPACCPIIEKHWLRGERKPGSFAQEAAKSGFGNGWTPPEDFDFHDHAPPPIAAPADQEDNDDIVTALLKRRVA